MKNYFFSLIVCAVIVALAFAYRSWDINRFDLPTHFEITPWAKSYAAREIAKLTKPIQASDVSAAYAHLAASTHHNVVHFKIAAGRVSADVRGDHLRDLTYFKVLNFVLTEYAKQGVIKDCELLILIDDVCKNVVMPAELAHVPIFTFARPKTPDTNAIALLIVDPYTLKSWSALYAELQKAKALSNWAQKRNMLFWRGKSSDAVGEHGQEELHNKAPDTMTPRMSLVALTHTHPALVDARFVKLYVLSKDAPDIDVFKTEAPRASITDHVPYKYQITLDGVTSTYPGYLWRLASGCVNFKQDSSDEQWFYELFKADTHYVPVARDLSDLKAKLDYAMTHDAEMQAMTQRAHDVVEQELTPAKVFGYFVELVNGYADRFAAK